MGLHEHVVVQNVLSTGDKSMRSVRYLTQIGGPDCPSRGGRLVVSTQDSRLYATPVEVPR